MPKRNSYIERVRQLRDAIAAGHVKPGVTYSADQVAKLLMWNTKTAKRLLPLVQTAQQLPVPSDWDEYAPAQNVR